jgi:endoribonuclease Dicer
MWRKAVSLPCILYRINALLLADEIRTIVAKDISLGSLNLSFGIRI